MKNEFKLQQEIIGRSTTKNWQDAAKEWSFLTAFQRENSQCLCGKQNIKNVCVIINSENSLELEVGNCCVKKFMNIDEGDSIFNSINKLKKMISSSINKKCLEFLQSNNVINDWEASFYYNIGAKKKLTDKQKNVKIRVNEKCLNYFQKLSYEV